jgi:RNA polymerase-binding protein DksA
MSVEKKRYSDEELEFFKKLILEKLEKAQHEYEELKKLLTNEDSNDIMDTTPTFSGVEDGTETQNKEEIARLAQRQLKFINDLKAALVRIENKTYGICRETGKLISKERLMAVPHATLSIEAKLNRDKNKK